MKLSQLRLTAFALFASLSFATHAENIGSVDTAFKLIGPDHKVVVEAYDDPKVNGVTCYVSRAKTGGISGGLGLAEDKAEASIACRQVGPISFPGPLRQQDEVFNQSLSILFKKLRIVRMVDQKRNALVYLTYSDKLVDGSPKNSVTAVAVDQSTPIPVK
ncbi:CreA family protein [Undibacterium sp. TS12]|uniref:CreA family protein n=1 Tax=Undibacterium sp. TS12 TaxID=2908202 RepID=UPI001F4CEEA0|nr:CreA family protein [Undibacterium sp. TS12]MCH8619321.1 CreA family protein [Undibacterium sp. TS12]